MRGSHEVSEPSLDRRLQFCERDLVDFDAVLSRRHGQTGRRKPGRVRPGANGRFVRPLDEPRRRPLRFGWNTDRRRHPRNELAGPAWGVGRLRSRLSTA